MSDLLEKRNEWLVAEDFYSCQATLSRSQWVEMIREDACEMDRLSGYLRSEEFKTKLLSEKLDRLTKEMSDVCETSLAQKVDGIKQAEEIERLEKLAGNFSATITAQEEELFRLRVEDNELDI